VTDLIWHNGTLPFGLGVSPEDWQFGPDGSFPWFTRRFDAIGERFGETYRFEIPYIDRGCMAALAYDPSRDWIATEAGVRPLFVATARDDHQWITRGPARGFRVEGELGVSWGSRGLDLLQPRATQLDSTA
jgi:streptogramin lyase